MKLTEKVIWNVYTGVLSTLATFIAQKVITKVWEAATGDEPPDPNDPETPAIQALIWAVSSGVGIGVTQIMMNRFVQKRWSDSMGSAPGKLKNHLDIR
ncbi:DUF4235 domain-containing protein [Tessaracoccus sp. OH4464_COT-324]|uniref:DUF4235 domain-containing protein n=1 Tax=Tessaracoccus sp. OH4464_COT-324 TaxID=2491059 RepID=UPI000F634BF1|nr:DUF4235 domain-containing protein [Tessaracoccus sp. OH4464_COT-324]RRD47402.1 DUF4235 domain-containing protein [Tessaracoccus sp. OH4464_COT-324]